MLKQSDLSLPFVSQFFIGQKVWSLGLKTGIVVTMTPNGFDENGDRYPDSIGIRYENGAYAIKSSDHVFESLEAPQKHTEDAHRRCDERNAQIQEQFAYLKCEPKANKWTVIASRYGKVDFLDFGFESYDEALAHVKAMNEKTDGYPIAILTPTKDKYWMNSFSDREDAEFDLKNLGLSPQFEGTFSI